VLITKNYDYWGDRYVFQEDMEPMNPLDTGFGLVSQMWRDTFKGLPYHISGLIPADRHLSERLMESLKLELGQENVVNGVNASADSFYSSQGRQDIAFGDDNDKLIDALRNKHPNCETLEMESGMILHLAQTCTHQSRIVASHPGPIRASCCAMIFFNRITNAAIPPDHVNVLELKAGKAVLDALVATPLDENDEYVDVE
jgi:uridine phosphorylase